MTEQQPYDVVRSYDNFELRRYPEHLVAEVVTDGPFEKAGNRAFRDLFSYISGANGPGEKVAMTSPVVQDVASLKIEMTSPVVQQAAASDDSFRVAFVLPAGFTAETAPQPTNPKVRLRTVPASSVAATRYRGLWNEAGYQRHLAELRTAIGSAGLSTTGEPRFARFDPPYLPAFLRRNEVMIDIAE